MNKPIITIFTLLWTSNVECTSTTESIPSTTESTVFPEDVPTSESTIIQPHLTTVQPLPIINKNYWMKRMGPIREDLLRVQAIIVKDEDISSIPCNEGKQKSDSRYLMCSGSILSRNRILTSASCLHEALHIRHNVRAPLAVVIAPLRSTVQIIKVAEYRIHPQHNSNPHSPNHIIHNLAILSLSCKISSKNYYKVELPKETMANACTEEDCFVTILRKTGYSSNVMYQVRAPYFGVFDSEKRKRSVEFVDEDNLEPVEMTDPLAIGSNKVKKIFKRYTDGTGYCSQTGAPIMLNNTQVSSVAVSCDDRQSPREWKYTYIYPNLEWIHSIFSDWNKTESLNNINNNITGIRYPHASAKSCGNCIFNFYISVGCKEKGNCPRNGQNAGEKPTNLITQDRVLPNEDTRVKLTAENLRPLKADVNRTHRSSFKCFNNTRECVISSPITSNGIRRFVPVQRLRPGIISMDRKPNRFINRPVAIRNPVGKWSEKLRFHSLE